MISRSPYIDLQNRGEILLENANLFLIEEQNYFEGNFLVFSDTQPLWGGTDTTEAVQSYESLQAEIEDLQNKLLESEGVI